MAGARTLVAEAVSIGYGRTVVVDQLDLAVPEAAFTALVGPNGSGKSTILRALAGLLPVRHGAVRLDGRPIATLSSREIAKRVGVLQQGPTAPEGLTVLDLVQQGRYPHRSLFGRWSAGDDGACADALRLTGMEPLAGRLLDSLSGGQRQRAWIAMTLAQQTGIVLLDEPTTYLDLAHQIEVLDLLLDLVRIRRMTVVAVLHDLNQAARYADHMVLLNGGSVFAQGKPGDVVNVHSIRAVFGVETTIIADPVSGAPLCIPLQKAPQKD
jgi:iron complex transport system ATP-binding protein